jgi:type I restriction enzyme M protein
MENTQQLDIIWPIAELLRGDYKRSDYGKVILPFTILRRLDCILAPTKQAVLDAVPDATKKGEKVADYLLNSKAKQAFHNRSPYDFQRLLDDSNSIAANIMNYLNGFSANIREIFEYFSFADQVSRLDKANLLYKVVQEFGKVDLHPKDEQHPNGVDNHDMGAIFEELIRRFSEQSNETAGEHFTPREVIKLMVNLLFLEDREALCKEGIVRTLYDPACGTGGMLSVSEEYLRQLNPQGRLEVFGQEINPEAYAICKSDMIIKGHNAANIKFGNSFTTDGLTGEKFDYMLSNPPFGVEWKKVEESIRDEHSNLGYAGRFGAGLPRISDGSLLFLQHMLAKRKETDGSTRIGIIFNGSPLFSGGAGSGESNIRRWIIENDWLEAIVAMTDQLFYNTGIYTYIWIVTNRKSPQRQGKVQLINALGDFVKKRKSLGNKRNEIGDGEEGRPDQIGAITKVYGDFTLSPTCKIFDNADFGYRRITVERPLRMSFQISVERVTRLKVLKLPQDLINQATDVLNRGLAAGEQPLYRDLPAFQAAVTALWDQTMYAYPKLKQWEAILRALGERDEAAEILRDSEGIPVPDPELRDFENVSFKENVQDYFEREVRPYVSDAWINESICDEQDGEVGIVGYEIPFTRYFYLYEQPDEINKIAAGIQALEEKIQGMMEKALE